MEAKSLLWFYGRIAVLLTFAFAWTLPLTSARPVAAGIYLVFVIALVVLGTIFGRLQE